MDVTDFQVPGFSFAGVSAGIKKDGKRDLGLIYSEVPAQAAGLFTTNRVKAAPVRLDMERIRKGVCQAVVINSGNANACTGSRGLNDTRKMAFWISRHLGIDERLVLVSSTGVIGVPLPMPVIERSIPKLANDLSSDGWMRTVEAIMTTDTFPKIEVATCRIKGKRVKMCGMVKGAGMIQPHVATMLSYLVTDAKVKAPMLRRMLREVADDSYNCITLDGDMSTNDTVLLLANGKAGHPIIDRMGKDGKIFQSMLLEVCQNLVKSVVKDGEGATKFIEVAVKGARNREDAQKVAYAIANSALVKTAFFGEDLNWGRVMCAVGYSGAPIDPDRIDIFLDKVPIVKRGIGLGETFESRARKVLKEKSFKVIVNLHQGKGEFSVFTMDLSFDYVKINASYRS
jgi:glutamate N-acetyltransferase/amino-acid N-acetyltransferase